MTPGDEELHDFNRRSEDCQLKRNRPWGEIGPAERQAGYEEYGNMLKIMRSGTGPDSRGNHGKDRNRREQTPGGDTQ